MSTQHYTPSQAILDAHALPRYGGASNSIPPGVFGAAFIDAASSDPAAALRSSPYLVGVLAPGAALIAAGVTIFFIFFLAYCCACCRCCGACRPRPKATTTCRLLSRTTALIVMGCINLGLVLSAIASVPGFAAALGGIVASMQSAAGIMASGAALLGSPTPVLVAGVATPSVAAQLTAAGATAAALANKFAQCPPPPPLAPELDLRPFAPLFNNVSAFTTTFTADTVAAQGLVLSDNAGRLSNAITSWPIASWQVTISQAGLSVLAIISGFLFLQSILLCSNVCASWSFRVLAFFSLTLAALVYIVAGVFLIVGVLGSDLCYSPYSVMATLAASVDPTATLQYYLTCYGSAAAPPPLSVPALVLNASASVTQYAAELNSTLLFSFTYDMPPTYRLSAVNQGACPLPVCDPAAQRQPPFWCKLSATSPATSRTHSPPPSSPPPHAQRRPTASRASTPALPASSPTSMAQRPPWGSLAPACSPAAPWTAPSPPFSMACAAAPFTAP
jgi:hypothetical protein